MRMKRITALGLAVGLAAGLHVTPVLAHGHHGSQAVNKTENDYLCAVCTEENCVKKGWHVHDGSIYCGYGHECGYCDGTCDTAKVCTEAQCTETGHHTHAGKSYCGYDHESGYCDGTCDSITVCTKEGCTQTGRHTHDGVTYCGYGHTDGYCDGTCMKQKISGTRKNGHHHGHHS